MASSKVIVLAGIIFFISADMIKANTPPTPPVMRYPVTGKAYGFPVSSFTWESSTDNDVGDAIWYDIDLSTSPDYTSLYRRFQNLEHSLDFTTSFSTAVPFTDGLYYLRIRAKDNSADVSDYCFISFAIDRISPADITGLTAETNPSRGAIKLTWTVPPDIMGVSGYEVRLRQNTPGTYDSATVYSQDWPGGAAGGEGSNVVSGLNDETLYFFYLKAKDAAGNLSINASTASARSNTPPAVTIHKPATTVTVSGNYSIEFSVVDIDAQDYSTGIYLSQNSGASYPYVITDNLFFGLTYYIFDSKRFANGYINRIKIVSTDTAAMGGTQSLGFDFSIFNLNEPPYGQITKPSGGDLYKGYMEVCWKYSDPNGADTHSFSLYISSCNWVKQQLVAAGLPDKTTYFRFNSALFYDGENSARVVVTDSGLGGLQTELFSKEFYIANIDNPPSDFRLTAPSSGSVLSSRYPQFSWEEAVDLDPLDAVTYSIYYSTNNLNYSLLCSSLPAPVKISTAPFSEGGPYYWYVEAVDLKGLTKKSGNRFIFYVDLRRVKSTDGAAALVFSDEIAEGVGISVSRNLNTPASNSRAPNIRLFEHKRYKVEVTGESISYVSGRASVAFSYNDADGDGYDDFLGIDIAGLYISHLSDGGVWIPIMDKSLDRRNRTVSSKAAASQYYALSYISASAADEISCTVYPNPFTPAIEKLRIKYVLYRNSAVNWQVFNAFSELLFEESHSAGSAAGSGDSSGSIHFLEWTGRDSEGNICASGMYYLKTVFELSSGEKKEKVFKVGIVR